eukprot:gene9507-biopygen1683
MCPPFAGRVQRRNVHGCDESGRASAGVRGPPEAHAAARGGGWRENRGNYGAAGAARDIRGNGNSAAPQAPRERNIHKRREVGSDTVMIGARSIPCQPTVPYRSVHFVSPFPPTPEPTTPCWHCG